MNLLPPLRLLQEWREAGVPPAEIARRCQEIGRNVSRQAWQKLATAEERAEIAACERCRDEPHARGLCAMHYNRLWKRKKRVKNPRKYNRKKGI